MHRLNYPATYKDRSFCPTQSPSWEASEVKHWEMRPSSLRNKQLNRLSNDFIAKIVQLHCTKISCVKTGLRCPRKFLNCFLPRCLLVTQTFDHNILIIENKRSRWRMDLYRLDTTRGSYNNFPYFKIHLVLRRSSATGIPAPPRWLENQTRAVCSYLQCSTELRTAPLACTASSTNQQDRTSRNEW